MSNKETEALNRKLDELVAKTWEMAQDMESRSVYDQNLVKRECSKTILQAFKEAGGVFLASDQSLPTVYEIQRAFTGLDWSTCENLQKWLTEILANFKRIKKPEET